LASRFSKYTYKKEGIATDLTDGSESDDTVKRYRPFVEVNTEDKTNGDMAKWKMKFNKVDEVSLRGKMTGWDLEINTIIKLETSIVNNSFLIKDIVYSKGEDGTTSDIVLASKDAYV